MARRTRSDDDADLPVAKAPRRLLQPEMIAKIIRTVLSRELRGQVIRREHLLQAVSGSRVGFDALLNLVQEELAEVYGMKLVAVDVESAPQSKNRPKPKYIMVNILAPATNRKNHRSQSNVPGPSVFVAQTWSNRGGRK